MDQLRSGDAVTKSGLYSLIAPNGTVVFTVRMKKGDVLPISTVENGQFIFEG